MATTIVPVALGPRSAAPPYEAVKVYVSAARLDVMNIATPLISGTLAMQPYWSPKVSVPPVGVAPPGGKSLTVAVRVIGCPGRPKRPSAQRREGGLGTQQDALLEEADLRRNLTRTRNFEGDILISPCDLGGSGNVEGINLILPSALGDSGIIPTAASSRSSGPQNRLQEGRLIPGLRKRPRPRSFPGSRLVAFAGRGSPSRPRDHPPTHNRTVVMPGSRWGPEGGEVRPSFKLT